MFAQPAITAAAVAPKGRVEACAVTANIANTGMRHERGCQANPIGRQADPIKPVTIPELLTE
jgi:hypothetical protein